MDRRSSKRVEQRPKETKRSSTERENKRPKRSESRKRVASTRDTANEQATTRLHVRGQAQRISRQTTSPVDGPSLEAPNPEPREPARDEETTPLQMERPPKKSGDSKATASGAAGGSSAEDIRSEFRRMAESSGLQGILKTFGRVDELLCGGQNISKRIKEIVENLNTQDMSKVRMATDDLNNLLNNTSEDQYSQFPIEQIIPTLVRCMSFDEDFDVTLKAIRCLGTLARSLPSSCSSMVSHGAIPALCTRLLSIEVIDVAEESIRAIKYIAKESPEACLTNGALYAVLSYLDFFSHHEQRDAVESAAHMCRGLKPESCGLVIDQVPTLVNLLGYEDAILAEKASQALLCICEASVHNPETMQIMSETQLVGKGLELISGASVSPIKPSTFFGLIKILTLCAGSHPHIAELLIRNSISEILFNIFSTCASGWSRSSSAGMIKTADQLKEILKLTASLLPSAVQSEPDSPDAMEVTPDSSSLMGIFADNPDLVTKLGTDLLPVLLQVHDVTLSRHTRSEILSVWSKVVKIIDKESFLPIAKKLKISSLLCPLLTSARDEEVVQAMNLAETLMEKLPEIFASAFVEEGVAHAIAHLASPEMECELTGIRRSPRLQEMRMASAESSPANLSAERKEAMTCAQQFLNARFPGFCAHQDTNGILKVKTVTQKLNLPEHSQAALIELLRIMNDDGEGLSTFEFLRSQVVQSLNNWLSLGAKEKSGNENAEQALMNVKRLSKAGLSFATLSGSSPLQGLVHKLRDAIAACEAFPVREVIQRSIRTLGPSARTGSEDIKAQNLRLASLGQAVKLKLERHPSEKELKDLQPSQVLVEPLVMMHALEDYVLQRVKPGSDKHNKNPEQQQEESHEQSSSSRQDSGRGRSGMIRRSKFRPSSKRSSARHDSQDSESMSCSHDESEEGGTPFPEEDLFLDEEDDDGLDDEMSDEEDYDDDEEDDIEGLSHVHSMGNSEDMDDMDEEGGPSSSERRSYAQRLTKSKNSMIEFSIGDVAIKPHATIFQAIRESIAMRLGYEEELESKPAKMATFRHKWEETHVITYRRRPAKPDRSTDETNKASKGCNINLSDKWNVCLTMLKRVSIPEELDIDDELKQLLLLLKMLDTVNSLANRFNHSKEVVRQLSRAEFVSSKLTTKLSQQITDPLTVCSSSTPHWTMHLVTSCKFLFPFELRRKFFYCKLGVPRALLLFNKEYEAAGERKDSLKVERGDQEVKLSQLKPNRVRVSRSKILRSAMRIMEMYAHNANEVLEVNYYNESGVGEGPTLEFYTLMSQELVKRSLHMWRDDKEQGSVTENKDKHLNQKDGSVSASKGLFPRPYPPGKTPDMVVRAFTFMGRAIARSLIDGRLMDTNISPLFFRILRGEPVDMTDIQAIDPHLGTTLEKLQAALDVSHGGQILLDGASLEDLCLPYTLPGYEDYPLTGPEDAVEFVTDRNLSAYIEAVVAGTISEGVDAQIYAFKEGFESVLPVKMLEIFYDDELDLLLRGTQGCWTVEELSECVNFSHGYSPLCDQARWFLEILSELDDEQRRSFLQFLTGSPRLPPGGIAALSPKLTVVQRLNGREGASENDLPSVATCVNFLKLPKYGSKKVMKERLLIAFNEGQYAFDLS